METYNYEPITSESLIHEIKSIKHFNVEQFTFMFKNFLEAYIDGIKAFGRKDPFNKNLKLKFKEFYYTLKQENIYLDYLLMYIECFNLDAVDRILNSLDKINDSTIHYYDDYFDRASFAASQNNKQYLYSIKHNDTLLETDYYSQLIAGLDLTDQDIRDYLNYESEFWSFIEKYTSSIETTPEIAQNMAFVTPIYDGEGFVSSVRLFVPKVVDLDTALITLQIYTKAHNYFIDYMFHYNGCNKQFNKEEFLNSLDINELKLSKKA